MFYFHLAIRVTCALSKDYIISYDDIPAPFGDSESSKRLEILFSIYEGASTIISNRTGETVTINVEPPAFSQGC